MQRLKSFASKVAIISLGSASVVFGICVAFCLFCVGACVRDCSGFWARFLWLEGELVFGIIERVLVDFVCLEGVLFWLDFFLIT